MQLAVVNWKILIFYKYDFFFFCFHAASVWLCLILVVQCSFSCFFNLHGFEFVISLGEKWCHWLQKCYDYHYVYLKQGVLYSGFSLLPRWSIFLSSAAYHFWIYSWTEWDVCIFTQHKPDQSAFFFCLLFGCTKVSFECFCFSEVLLMFCQFFSFPELWSPRPGNRVGSSSGRVKIIQ